VIGAFDLISAFCSIAGPKEQSSVDMASPRGRMSFPLRSFLMICLMAQLGASNVVLMANNTTLSFDDVEAIFSECYTLLHCLHEATFSVCYTLLHYLHVSLYISIAI
jgi:hypothetical protein